MAGGWTGRRKGILGWIGGVIAVALLLNFAVGIGAPKIRNRSIAADFDRVLDNVGKVPKWHVVIRSQEKLLSETWSDHDETLVRNSNGGYWLSAQGSYSWDPHLHKVVHSNLRGNPKVAYYLPRTRDPQVNWSTWQIDSAGRVLQHYEADGEDGISTVDVDPRTHLPVHVTHDDKGGNNSSRLEMDIDYGPFDPSIKLDVSMVGTGPVVEEADLRRAQEMQITSSRLARFELGAGKAVILHRLEAEPDGTVSAVFTGPPGLEISDYSWAHGIYLADGAGRHWYPLERSLWTPQRTGSSEDLRPITFVPDQTEPVHFPLEFTLTVASDGNGHIAHRVVNGDARIFQDRMDFDPSREIPLSEWPQVQDPPPAAHLQRFIKKFDKGTPNAFPYVVSEAIPWFKWNALESEALLRHDWQKVITYALERLRVNQTSHSLGAWKDYNIVIGAELLLHDSPQAEHYRSLRDACFDYNGFRWRRVFSGDLSGDQIY